MPNTNEHDDNNDQIKTPKVSDKKPVILCVDDEKFILDTLNRQLQRRFGDAYEYEFAENADEAIEVIDELAKEGYNFVMVISDQVMPGMAGDKFLSHVHKQDPNLIKILLTGQASVESAINVINNANLYRYLMKPWREDDFLLTVQKGLEQYTLFNNINKQNKSFSYFVPYEFLEALNKKSILDINLGDHVKQEMTALFTDLSNFTNISEHLSSEETYAFINKVIAYIEPAIRENHGFIDKYVGDAILALFYEPNNAIKASLAIQQAINQFNKDDSNASYYPIKCGIGLHTGILTLGIVGVPTRMQGTVISDVVNLASRLQSLTSRYRCNIIVSEYLLTHLTESEDNAIISRFLGRIKVKGKDKVISFYEIIDINNDEDASAKINSKVDFEKGVNYFLDKKFAEACLHFNATIEKNPNDTLAKLYLKNSADYMVHGVDSNWTGFIAVDKDGVF